MLKFYKNLTISVTSEILAVHDLSAGIAIIALISSMSINEFSNKLKRIEIHRSLNCLFKL